MTDIEISAEDLQSADIPTVINENETEEELETAETKIQPESEKGSVECFALVLKEKLLPATIEELVPLSFVGETALQFYKARIEGMKKLSGANLQLDETYKDGLQVAEMLFRVYEKLGLLAEENTADPAEAGSAGGKGVPAENTLFSSVSKMAKKLNVTRKRLEDAKCIARDPQFIETILDEARKREVLPSKTKLLALIRAGYPGKSKKRRRNSTESKHAGIEEGNKRLASRTITQKCTDAILEASSYMKAIVALWDKIPDEEKRDFTGALFEFLPFVEELRKRYAPREENQGA
jgi:hypothetical protein